MSASPPDAALGEGVLNVSRGTVDRADFSFECGQSLPIEIAYETYGDPRNETVLICHALTGSAHVATVPDPAALPWDACVPVEGQSAAWWSDLVGPGKGIDTDEYHVVCVNVPGSCYGTTGPASEGPDGEPYGSDFPPVTVGDWTRAQRLVLDDLGVDGLRAVVGGSVGGMNVLEWVRRYPEQVELAVPIATGARLDARLLALDAIRRRAIRADPAWNGGDYYGGPGPQNGLALARQLGHVMYRSSESLAHQFGRKCAEEVIPREKAEAARELFPGATDPYLAIESYLDTQAARFTERFDANSYLAMTRAMANYELGSSSNQHPERADVASLSGFEGEALLVSFSGDWHFPVEGSRALEQAFRRAGIPVTHKCIDAGVGHDAFLTNADRIARPVRTAISGGVDGQSTDRTVAPVHASLFGS